MELSSMNVVSYSKLLQTPYLLHSRPSIPAYSCATVGGFNGVNGRILLCSKRIEVRRWRKFGGAVRASQAESTSTEVEEKWLLEPVGDGDSRHIGYKVAMPGAIEIASSVVTVGRVAEKADIVIPVATVSGLHARIQQKEGNLVVTDLDSTNGTFIDDIRLTPGVPATVSPGRLVTFGDTNLAIFKVSKLENVEVSAEAEEAKG